MTTYADAERARREAIAALRDAGLDEQAERLAALPPVTDRETADAAYHRARFVADTAAGITASVANAVASSYAAARAAGDAEDALDAYA